MSAINTPLPLLLTLVASVAMVGTLSWQGYDFWQKENQSNPLARRQAAETLPDTPQAPPIELSSLDLFGSADQGGTPAEVDTENLPETNLRLFLRGVMAAEGDFPGSALIEDDKSKTEAYLVGDELPGNAKLRSVHPNRVIIERGGKLENLYFPEQEDRRGMDVAQNDTEQTEQTEEPSRATSTAPPRTTVTPAADEQRREEIRRRLEQLRERLRNNSN